MRKLIPALAVIFLSHQALAASASSSASSSSTGSVTISGSATGAGTVHASAIVTRNGVTVRRAHIQVGPGSFNDHAD